MSSVPAEPRDLVREKIADQVRTALLFHAGHLIPGLSLDSVRVSLGSVLPLCDSGAVTLPFTRLDVQIGDIQFWFIAEQGEDSNSLVLHHLWAEDGDQSPQTIMEIQQCLLRGALLELGKRLELRKCRLFLH